MKACNKCQTERSLDEFRIRRGKHISVCRDCERVAQRKYYWAKPEKHRKKSAENMRRVRADPTKRAEHLKKQRAYYHSSAKFRERIYHQEIKETQPWLWRARNLKRNASSQITETWLRDQFEKQSGLCALSGRYLDVRTFHVDHIVPKKHGGTDDLANLRLVSPEANMAKSGLLDAELISLCRDILRTQIPELIGHAILKAEST